MKQMICSKEVSKNMDHIKEHLLLLLSWLDCCIELRVALFRSELGLIRNESSLQQLYISHDEVDYHLKRESISKGSNWNKTFDKLLNVIKEKKETLKKYESTHYSVLPLNSIREKFNLNDFEMDALIICLAPELDRKYDRLYAYLQDDVTRKRPSVDLILDLLCKNTIDKWEKKAHFDSLAPLLMNGLIHEYTDTQCASGSSSMARFMKIDSAIAGICCGYVSIESQFAHYVKIKNWYKIEQEKEDTTQIDELVRAIHFKNNQPESHIQPIEYIKSSNLNDGYLFIQNVCNAINKYHIKVNTTLILSDEHIHEIIRCIYRWAKINDAIVVIDGLDDNERKDTSFEKFMLILTQCIELYRVITFAYGTREWYVNLQKITHSVYQTTLFNPDYTMQKRIWSEKIQTKGEYADAAGIEKIISMYSLTEAQIEEAVEIVHRKRIVEKSGKISEQQLIMAARNVASRSLQLYGTRIQPVLSWNDIVLPQYTIEQLKELCRHARFANKVLNEWGFCNRSKYNSGLNVLLFGTPGTGKTMAAEVIANDLELELYKVDLSMVVSKYIGETEKNLGAVFNEAQNLKAILFFDEADALFGKRTEINDSHDRYANIEISYLLQRIEYHEGIVLLASNYKGNIDDAFTRRFRFFIELPFPDTMNRKEIWRKQFPPETPVEDDIQYDMLAEKYSLSGGSIKNACIRAAFLAASQNTPIGNDHLLYGIQQEYKKMGKPWIEPVNNNRVFRNMIDKSFVGAR